MSKIYKILPNDGVTPCTFEEGFDFLNLEKCIISIVGAGGKTTLLYLMARYYSGIGRKTLVTTTTHIYRPNSGFVSDLTQAEERWSKGEYVAVGAPTTQNKLNKLGDFELDEWISRADVVLVEADGSRGLPFKVPGEGEPVLLPQTDVVVAVLGADSLGKPLRNVCHRLELCQKILQKGEDDVITPKDYEIVFSSPNGLKKGVGAKKYYAVFNQCDSENMLNELTESGIALHRGGAEVVFHSIKD